MVRIARTDVVTPVAGVVSRRTARLGAMAMWAGEALFRVIADGRSISTRTYRRTGLRALLSA